MTRSWAGATPVSVTDIVDWLSSRGALLDRAETRPIGRRKLKGFTERIELHALRRLEAEKPGEQIDEGFLTRADILLIDPANLAVA
ncbi:hypothetical protein ACFPL7_04975 [Dongia soli]|uniref:Uncharacterized protein n=1 Tax=Dongia soli TaxID=600628 RepID=A0ABU5EH94_9PROT|nr:hypothetical protein [Dongia soli]MDY0884751.1 hypothetical protein [Dongia soli]